MSVYVCMCICMHVYVPRVLQYFREFDAHAMQSCIPLPCGTGSWQNRRLREQTLPRKPCHYGSIKGGWCMELPTSLDQPLQVQTVCACLDRFLPVWDLYLLPEREPLITCKSKRHFNTFCWQLPWYVQLHETPYKNGRRQGYQAPRYSTPSSVDSGKSARKKKKTTNANCTMERQDSARPRSIWSTRNTYGTSSNGTCQIQHRHRRLMWNKVLRAWKYQRLGILFLLEWRTRKLIKGGRSGPTTDRNATASKWQNLSKDDFATIISVYTPTMTNPDENKEAFYNQLAIID